MPYLRSNWDGMASSSRFQLGQVFSIDSIKLVRPACAGPRGCFLHVTMEQEARVGYLELVLSARSLEVYVLKGGHGASGEYLFVGKLDGRQAVDHPYKYHYKFGSADLPETKVALLQLRLAPHSETASEVNVFRLSILVGDAPRSMRGYSTSSSTSAALSLSSSMGVLQASAPLSSSLMTSGSSKLSSSRTSLSRRRIGDSAGAASTNGGALTRGAPNQVAISRSMPEDQQLVRGCEGGEAAVVADALNDVMGKMLTVVTRKTKGYVGSTYRKTEDKIQARMRNIEVKISGFERTVCQSLEKRLLDLEHVLDTLHARQTQEQGLPSYSSRSPHPVQSEHIA